MRILGIETSCDETAAAIIEADPTDKNVKLLSNVVASSLTLHSKTGGIIPEIAAREQVKYIIPVIEEALRMRHSGKQSSALQNGAHPESPTTTIDAGQASMTESIDAIAVTVGPGLIGSLLVGVETARTLAYVWKKPIIPVNHLVGHIYANFVSKNPKSKIQNPKLDARRYDLNADIKFPALALIVSGGHTDLVLMKKHGNIKWLGGTRDDAAGEAFDKIGRLLGLPYPGGPAVEKAAQKGNPKAFNFPRPMIDSNDFDFSFSGLKTAVLNLVKKGKLPNRHSGDPDLSGDSRISNRAERFWTSLSTMSSRPNGQNDAISDIAASVQQAIIDVLVSKTLKAAQKYKVKSILLSGGVAANQKLRDEFKLNAKIFAPAKTLCTDNAAMIAAAAFFNYKPLPWRKVAANPELYFD